MKTAQEQVDEAQAAYDKTQDDYRRIGGPYLFNKLTKCAENLKKAEHKRRMANAPVKKVEFIQANLF